MSNPSSDGAGATGVTASSDGAGTTGATASSDGAGTTGVTASSDGAGTTGATTSSDGAGTTGATTSSDGAGTTGAAKAGLVIPLGDRVPEIHPEAWLAPHSVVSGRVIIGAGTSIWYGASVRGDAADITIGERSNLQDNGVIHADPGHPATVGNDVSIGHAAVVHGATVGDGTIIGMGSVLLNGSVIGEGSLVAAGAVVLEGTQVPPGSLVAGIPAKVRRPLTEEERAGLRDSIGHYPGLAQVHRTALSAED